MIPLLVTGHRRERDAFITAAADLCRLHEDAKELGSERFLLGLAGALPRLQATAVELPYPDDADEIPDDDADVDLTTEEMGVLKEPVADVLREIDWEQIRDMLPETEMTAGEAIEMLEETREGVPESMLEAWAQARENLRRYLPEARSPYAPDPLPIDLSLSEDLGETCYDLKNGFRLLEAGRPEAEAVFHWRLTFWSHWGYHNVGALRVIHYYVAGHLAG